MNTAEWMQMKQDAKRLREIQQTVDSLLWESHIIMTRHDVAGSTTINDGRIALIHGVTLINNLIEENASHSERELKVREIADDVMDKDGAEDAIADIMTNVSLRSSRIALIAMFVRGSQGVDKNMAEAVATVLLKTATGTRS